MGSSEAKGRGWLPTQVNRSLCLPAATLFDTALKGLSIMPSEGPT